MFDAQDLIAVFFFVVPGFVAVEVSNALTPRRSLHRSDQEKLSGMLIFGALIYTVFAHWLGLSFGQVVTVLSETSQVNAFYVLFFFIAAVLLGAFWGWIKGDVVRRAYYAWADRRLRRGGNGYLGALSVWDLLLERHVAARFIQVRTDDNLVFTGRFFMGSDTAGDQELVLDSVYWHDVGVSGTHPVPIENNPLVYIPLAKARYVIVYRPDTQVPGSAPVSVMSSSGSTEAQPAPPEATSIPIEVCDGEQTPENRTPSSTLGGVGAPPRPGGRRSGRRKSP